MAENVTASGPHGADNESKPSEPMDISEVSSPSDPKLGFGMTPNALPMYAGKKDALGRFLWQTEYPQDARDPEENLETGEWALIIRRTRVWGDPERKLALHSITVQSPLIKLLLQDVFKNYPGVTVSQKPLEFRSPFQPLLHRWPALRKAIESMQEERGDRDDDSELNDRIQHARLLDDLLQEEFADVAEAMKDYNTNGVITFQHLWMIFEPGSVVFTAEEGEDWAMEFRNWRYLTRNDERAFELSCKFADFDGYRFGSQETAIYVKGFTGTKSINALEAFPMTRHAQAGEMMAKLIERGGKFESLAGSHFRHYDGLGLRRNRNGSIEQSNVNGRVVIDTFGFNRCNPTQSNCFPPSMTPAMSGDEYIPPQWTKELDDRLEGRRKDASGFATEAFGEGGVPQDAFSEQNRPKLSDYWKLLCSPYVRGYALNEKKWLVLTVSGVSDITFNELAFSDLRLADEQKDLITGIASSHQSYRNETDDLIEGKGRGVLVLLRGPPGVGKTFTVESVAEKMQVPLFALTPGDLGLDPTTIEDRLRGLISMCSRWGAIIVLDEADVLLAERSHHELERNRIVSVFLRVVEYYEGIMFLTTNRVSTIDPAFQSRINVSLEYPELDRNSRKGIWETLLRRHDVAQANARERPAPPLDAVAKFSTKRALSPQPSSSNSNGNSNGAQAAEELHRKLTQPHRVSDEEIDKLAELKLNGSQIKNFMRTAQLMAIFKEDALTYRLIDTAVSVTHHFQKAKEANDEAGEKTYG
ncbi:hypothetical protein INS49_006370 [Diaporthe citri]|uniref:uncharacterized protein n=1 Tax=Diaporthe citri TaxID=83186 RepID=UPI001C7E3185|nr:uncharacterized protein INS49_006370 [Diaporthe citri]KAG6364766.1 hypothetical protein INS49_006370 [Diaporthe citri]